ncbi:glycoprotein endo-alpha-1,2-mannosidase-like protein isoform X2 [Halyomorpha halys]|uniref:glycoprotein endo-alpha-1,2-mannosidase-like protein isoform X2 n=1 Tax=Halyomorpha halys TaxID=286706 RepID=UPI0006D4DE18
MPINNALIIKSYVDIWYFVIGVVVLSWLPPSFPDSPGDILQRLMDTALKYELKVAFQIYFYTGRTHKSIIKQIQYLMLKVGDHPSLYLLKKEKKLLPVFYIHESYKHSSYFWKEILSEKGNISLRKTKYDGTFIGHLSDQNHMMEIKHASFDGLYTYSSGNGHSYGSSWKNWNSLAKFCQENTLLFIPSVGPGFSDISSIKDTRHRLKGNYYEVGWRSALSKRPWFVSISSFNNWEDGSQIEPAKSKKSHTRVYLDYEPEGSLFYINLTRWWVKQFLSSSE